MAGSECLKSASLLVAETGRLADEIGSGHLGGVGDPKGGEHSCTKVLLRAGADVVSFYKTRTQFQRKSLDGKISTTQANLQPMRMEKRRLPRELKVSNDFSCPEKFFSLSQN